MKLFRGVEWFLRFLCLANGVDLLSKDSGMDFFLFFLFSALENIKTSNGGGSRISKKKKISLDLFHLLFRIVLP